MKLPLGADSTFLAAWARLCTLSILKKRSAQVFVFLTYQKRILKDIDRLDSCLDGKVSDIERAMF